MFVEIPQFLEAVAQRCSVRKGVLRNFSKFTGKHRARVSFLIKSQTSALKLPWRSNTFNKVASWRIYWVSLLRGCFSSFLNCTSDNRSRKASHVTKRIATQPIHIWRFCQLINVVCNQKLWIVQSKSHLRSYCLIFPFILVLFASTHSEHFMIFHMLIKTWKKHYKKPKDFESYDGLKVFVIL